jgi:succinoglycan biosynthesis protein ExoM
MTARLVSIIIPTFKRPDAFVRAARSVFAQRGFGMAAEIIAIDNDPAGSALDVFRTLAAEAPYPFHWAHEPRPGVSHARNAAMALARGDLIAFLDDDEEATPGWLASLIQIQRETNADGVFGAIQGRVGPDVIHHRAFLERFFSRRGPTISGPIDDYFGMGNSLLVRARLLAQEAPFDPRANAQGGEDDILFSQAQAKGARFAWAAEALVYEHAPAHRARLGYALHRAFAFGQGPSKLAWDAKPRNYLGVLRHMTIGAGQALIVGPLAGVAFLISLPGRANLAQIAVSGAGKFFWPFAQYFYGEKPKKTPRPKPPKAPRRPVARVPLV